jgi:hypothetical protein
LRCHPPGPRTPLGDLPYAGGDWPDATDAALRPAAASPSDGYWDYAEYDRAGNLVAAGFLPGPEPLCTRLDDIAADGLETVAARSYDPRPGRWLIGDLPIQ